MVVSLEFYLDVALVVLGLIFVYLFYTRVMVASPVPVVSEEAQTLAQIAQKKREMIDELEEENESIERGIKQAKLQYLKKKINAATYKQMLEDAEDQLNQNAAKIELLKQ